MEWLCVQAESSAALQLWGAESKNNYTQWLLANDYGSP